MRTETSHGPETHHPSIEPLLILVILALLFPAMLLVFITLMASWGA